MIKRRKSQLNIPMMIPKLMFPMAFWDNGIKVFYVPHNVDKIKARQALQEMLDRNKKSARFTL